jgi:hypothetical protein
MNLSDPMFPVGADLHVEGMKNWQDLEQFQVHLGEGDAPSVTTKTVVMTGRDDLHNTLSKQGERSGMGSSKQVMVSPSGPSFQSALTEEGQKTAKATSIYSPDPVRTTLALRDDALSPLPTPSADSPAFTPAPSFPAHAPAHDNGKSNSDSNNNMRMLIMVIGIMLVVVVLAAVVTWLMARSSRPTVAAAAKVGFVTGGGAGAVPLAMGLGEWEQRCDRKGFTSLDEWQDEQQLHGFSDDDGTDQLDVF